MPDSTIQSRLQALRERIAGRATLVAMGKGQPPQLLDAAFAAGVRHFGENYMQELRRKQAALCHPQMIWHYTGRLQRSNSAYIAGHCQWVHSLCGDAMARRLHDRRPPQLPPLNVLIQLNLSGDSMRPGLPAAMIAPLAQRLAALPRLRLRGIMAMPPLAESSPRLRADCAAAASVLAQLRSAWPQLDTLSLGMSGDYETAMECGSTMVRIGTALFGPRPS